MRAIPERFCSEVPSLTAEVLYEVLDLYLALPLIVRPILVSVGKLFHIDFGFILGRDPKPLPPPMRLSKEMVEAMGGPGSEHFADFKRLCYTAFLHLRRYFIC